MYRNGGKSTVVEGDNDATGDKEVLERALAGRFAMGAFNANNMEMVQAIVETAQEGRAPVILRVSQGAICLTRIG